MKTYNKDQPLLVFARNWLIQPFKLAGPETVTALLNFSKKFLSNFTSLETLTFKHVRQSIRWLHFIFFRFLFFDLIAPCPNGKVTSEMAPAHPHATGVAA